MKQEIGYWEIDKTLEFCYAHRVWSQQLDGEFSDNLKCACRHRHGHEAKVQVYLTGSELVRGMITDFRHLEWAKKFLNEYVDHKFIVDKNDPAFDVLIGENKKFVPILIPGVQNHIGEIIDCSKLDPKSWQYELDEGVLVVDFIPTSENLSKWVAKFIDEKMKKLNVAVAKVDWWETPKSRSTYYNSFAFDEQGRRWK